MRFNWKGLILLFCLFWISSKSFGQTADSLATSKKVLEKLEIEALVSLHETQEFNATPGFGGQVNLFAPFFNGRFRLGMGIGIGGQIFGYALERGIANQAGIRSYNAELDANMINGDLLIGTNVFPKSKFDLTFNFGARINYMFKGNYHFNHQVGVSLNESEYEFAVNPSIHPAVLASITFSYPISERSSFGFSYGFSYSFLPFLLKPNSSSNDLYYQMDWYYEQFAQEADDYIVALPFFESADNPFYLVYVEYLDIPSYLGGQHSFSFSYRFNIGLRKENK